jgi:hypothetical protein
MILSSSAVFRRKLAFKGLGETASWADETDTRQQVVMAKIAILFIFDPSG